MCGRHHISHLGGDPIEKDGGAACSGLFSTGTKKLCLCGRGVSLLAVVGEIRPCMKFPSGHFDTGCSKIVKVDAQMLTNVCIAHAGVHSFESYLADVLVAFSGCSQLGQRIRYFIARYTTMAWNPHEGYFASRYLS